jgi:hypothetical protein
VSDDHASKRRRALRAACATAALTLLASCKITVIGHDVPTGPRFDHRQFQAWLARQPGYASGHFFDENLSFASFEQGRVRVQVWCETGIDAHGMPTNYVDVGSDLSGPPPELRLVWRCLYFQEDLIAAMQRELPGFLGAPVTVAQMSLREDSAWLVLHEYIAARNAEARAAAQ